MLKQDMLETSFRVYFDEIHRCQYQKCYWALLHIVIVLPDICAALEANDGKAKTKLYKNWCARYLADEIITADEWHDIRCVILHQGRTLADKGRYRTYSFGQPDERNNVVHRMVFHVNGVYDLHLDVDRLADEMFGAMHVWFQELVSVPKSQRAGNVERNLLSLANVSQRGNEKIEGFVIRQTLPITHLTTSSPH